MSCWIQTHWLLLWTHRTQHYPQLFRTGPTYCIPPKSFTPLALSVLSPAPVFEVWVRPRVPGRSAVQWTSGSAELEYLAGAAIGTDSSPTEQLSSAFGHVDEAHPGGAHSWEAQAWFLLCLLLFPIRGLASLNIQLTTITEEKCVVFSSAVAVLL